MVLLGRPACLSATLATNSPRYGPCALKNLAGFCSFCDFGIWVLFFFLVLLFIDFCCDLCFDCIATVWFCALKIFLGFVVSVIWHMGVLFLCDFVVFLLLLWSFFWTIYPLCGFCFLGFVVSVILVSGYSFSIWFTSWSSTSAVIFVRTIYPLCLITSARMLWSMGWLWIWASGILLVRISWHFELEFCPSICLLDTWDLKWSGFFSLDMEKNAQLSLFFSSSQNANFPPFCRARRLQ